MYRVEAAWKLSQWDSLEKYLAQVAVNLKINFVIAYQNDVIILLLKFLLLFLFVLLTLLMMSQLMCLFDVFNVVLYW